MTGNQPDVYLFTTDECAPCEALKRKLDAARTQISFSLEVIDVRKIDTAIKRDIPGLPTMEFVKSKQRFTGDLDLDDLKVILYRNLYGSC